MNIPLLCIVGPTATGKTDLSVRLAEHFNGEIVSGDSMQIYRRMDIGTAKPTLEERRGIPHHMMDIIDPGEPFSVAAYVEMARAAVQDIHQRGKLPILVGGTGLYISSLIDNIRFSEQSEDKELRTKLKEVAAEKGNTYLHGLLAQVDPLLADKLHPGNMGRIIRALEVYEITGKPMSWHIEQSRQNPSPYNLCVIGLTCMNRDNLYWRINSRVEIMVKAGLLEEARALFSLNSATASQAIGYKELMGYFDGSRSLEECLEEIKKASRHYAKRQLTWFKKDERVRWLEIDSFQDHDELTAAALGIIKVQGFPTSVH